MACANCRARRKRIRKALRKYFTPNRNKRLLLNAKKKKALK